MKKTNAFTLAEILVTLVIIGVISAMTIPQLKKVSEEHSYVSATKKAYTTLTDLTRKLKTEYGPVKMWTGFSMLTAMKNEMNVANKSIEAYNILHLNGENSGLGITNSRSGFYTVDGVFWAVGDFSTVCDKVLEGVYTNACRIFYVDINGKSAPNIIGVDVHGFYLTNQGLFPFGAGEGISTPDCSKTGTGLGCTARIISEGKISW